MKTINKNNHTSPLLNSGSMNASLVEGKRDYSIDPNSFASDYIWKEAKVYDDALREMGNDAVDTAKTLGKLGYAAGVEMLPPGPVSIGDVSRIGFGVDPYTGEELTKQERFEEWAEWVATNGVVAGSHKINNIFGSIVKNGNDIKSVNNGYDKMEKNNGKQ